MATRREPSAADTDEAITDETFLRNEISFHPRFTSKLSFEKFEFGRCFHLLSADLFEHEALKISSDNLHYAVNSMKHIPS